MNVPFQFTGRIRSFKHAFRGIRTMLCSQQNARIHALATILAVLAGFFFRITGHEWCWIVLAITAVWAAEAMNTALELLSDATSPAFHPLIKKAKDVAAASVLIAAIGAVIIGGLVFGPYAVELLTR